MGDAQKAASVGTRRGVGAGVLLSALLALVVILSAGLSGPTHSSGPRFSVPRQQPAPEPTSTQSQPGQPLHAPGLPTLHNSGDVAFWVLTVVLVILGVISLAWLLSRWWAGRRGPRTSQLTSAAVQSARFVAAPAEEPEPETLLTGIEAALQALDEPREPADAIVRAWLGLERTAEQSGLRRAASETPTEFTRRVLRRVFSDDRAIATLLHLYQRTRFGEHPPTEADVAAVRAALSTLVDGWRAQHAALGGVSS